MASKALSQITPSVNPPGSTDQFVGVTNGVNDRLWTLGQIAAALQLLNSGGGGGGGGGTVTQVNTGTGLTGGPITATGTIALANTAVTPGAYTNADITIDQQGRITAAANGTGGGSSVDTTIFQDLVAVTSPNTLASLSRTITGHMFLLIVNGQTFLPLGTAPPFTATGSQVIWNAANAGFSLATTDVVAAVYTTTISTPTFAPPQISGVNPIMFADFANNNYFYNGVSYSSFAAWNAAMGGTFARPGTATYFSGGVVQTAASGQPRFPTDNNSVPQGLRINGGGTNLHLHSAISDSIASYSVPTAGDALTTTSASTAPDGSTNAASFVPGTANATHSFRLTAGISVTSGTEYTYFIFARANGYTNFQVDGDNLGTHFATFQLSGAGTVVNTTGCTAVIVQLGAGWYLCAVTFTATATATVNPVIYVTGNGTARTWTPNGTSGYYFWGNQFTQTNAWIDYIPATTSAANQNEEDFNIPHTFGTVQSTVVAKLTANVSGQPGGNNSVGGIFSINDGNAFTNWLDLRCATEGFGITSAGTAYGVVTGIPFVDGVIGKIACATKAGTQHASFNGAAVGTLVANPAAYPVTLTTLTIGALVNNDQYAYTNIQQIGVWDTSFATDAQLQALSALP